MAVASEIVDRFDNMFKMEEIEGPKLAANNEAIPFYLPPDLREVAFEVSGLSEIIAAAKRSLTPEKSDSPAPDSALHSTKKPILVPQ
jgi:hypothetical protein